MAMDPDYKKLQEFELSEVDEDIALIFREFGEVEPFYGGLPTMIQIARHLRRLVALKEDQRG